MTENATFYTFKPSGKWAYSGRGNASDLLFHTFTHNEQRAVIIDDNGGCIPGMNGNGVGYTIVVIPDENHTSGWPLHINVVQS